MEVSNRLHAPRHCCRLKFSWRLHAMLKHIRKQRVTLHRSYGSPSVPCLKLLTATHQSALTQTYTFDQKKILHIKPRYCESKDNAGLQATEQRGFLVRFSSVNFTFLTASIFG